MCISPVWLPNVGWHSDDGIHVRPGSYVPCLKCPECLKHRQDEWFTRFLCERLYQLKRNPRSYTAFFTLTYSPEHLPSTRERSIIDIQTFRKNLNRYAKLKRFYITQEFGDTFNRVHFHGLVFGVDYPVVLLRTLFDKCWSKGRTNVQVCRSDGAFRYVGMYVLKSLNNKENDLWKPYSNSSQRPALGHSYISSYTRDVLSSNGSIGFRSPANGYFVEPRSWKALLRTPIGQTYRKLYLSQFMRSRGELTEEQKQSVRLAWKQKTDKYKRKKIKWDYLFNYLQQHSEVKELSPDDIKRLSVEFLNTK